MVSNRAHHRRSTGIYYADSGNPDAEVMLFKAQLTRRIAAIMAKHKLTQQETASNIGLSRPKLSLIVHGQFRGVSEAKLRDSVRHLGEDVRVTMKLARPYAEVGNNCT